MGACHNCGETITDVVGFRATYPKSHSYRHCMRERLLPTLGRNAPVPRLVEPPEKGRVVVHCALASSKIRAEKTSNCTTADSHSPLPPGRR